MELIAATRVAKAQTRANEARPYAARITSVIEDLATFTHALRSHGPGDLVEIRLLREGKELNFTVVLGDRSDRK